jgi:hypothetical protein
MRKMEIATGVINMVERYFNLDVDVTVRPTNECLPEDNGYCLTIGEGQYEIELHPEFLKNCTEEELVQVVSHEMVHVKQHELEGLELEVNRHSYQGIWYDPEDNYWFTPWEIEARGYERAFLALWNENWEKFI